MPAFPSTSRRILLAMLGPDPGDDFPDVILGPDDLAIGRHRPDNILGSYPHEALLLEGVARAQASAGGAWAPPGHDRDDDANDGGFHSKRREFRPACAPACR